MDDTRCSVDYADDDVTPPPPATGLACVLAALKAAANAVFNAMGRVLFVEGDTPASKARKASMFLVNLLITVLCASSLTLTALLGEGTGLYWLWCGMALVASAVTCIYMAATRSASDLMVSLSVGFIYIEVMLFDINNAAEMGARISSIFVVVVDLLLVGRLPSRIAAGFVLVAITWQAILELEHVLRFGLLDMWGTAPHSERKDLCACDAPPCGNTVSTGVRTVFAAILTFLMDYVVTRRFADMVEAEQAVMKTAVEVSEEIAGALARFDLASARTALETDGASLPEELYASFQGLLGNLGEYKPYLPAALLKDASDDGSAAGAPDGEAAARQLAARVPAPGGVDGAEADLAVMFTDIRASTNIWGACPDGMTHGLRMHNACIRAAVAAHSGYEVKTIGDAFMVAFPHPSDAVRCGLEIQAGLVDIAWPEALLKIPECAGRSKPDGVWHGLVIRVGVHSGSVMCEQNALTGRFDYFGDTVNTAARMEAASKPGMVAGRPDIIGEVVEDPGCMVMYTAVLKGLNNNQPMPLVAAVPAALKGRCKLPHADHVASLKAQHRNRKDGSQASTPADAAKPRQSLLATTTSRATTAAVMVADCSSAAGTSAALREHLATAVVRVQASGGSVVTTIGSIVILSWTGNLFHSALQYIAGLARSTASYRTHVGAARGQVVNGTAGSGQQRFVTVVGPSVTYAVQLCVMAARHNAACLFRTNEDAATSAGPVQLGVNMDDVVAAPFAAAGELDGMGAVQELRVVEVTSPTLPDATERVLPTLTPPPSYLRSTPISVQDEGLTLEFQFPPPPTGSTPGEGRHLMAPSPGTNA
eukprot:TRINITY_DN2386_c0_g1_i1.p1 TRINITY_DN2386_c0_g1~~TRINITY_DN2386_c0_g1_i1.p1  ORF type:complete len:822 (+),score=269.22 TRINITY_DN2386_c0_g1_i1:79-2544(+)